MTTSQPEPSSIFVSRNEDVVIVRARVREASARMGFSHLDEVRFVTAASELARNMRLYAGTGVVKIQSVASGDKQGLRVTFEDQGPGIADLDLAMTDGYTTSRGLGKGLPGARRLVDLFEIESAVGQGTTVRITKWLPFGASR